MRVFSYLHHMDLFKLKILYLPPLIFIVYVLLTNLVTDNIANTSMKLDGLSSLINLNESLPPNMNDFHSRYYCNVSCPTGRPCEYLDEVDFRIMVLTYNRPDSLQKCLDSIRNLDTMGDRVSVEVWIDRSTTGRVSEESITVAQNFKGSWKNGRVCVHIQTDHAHIMGQWRDTWRPKPDTKEIGLILEDDIDISPLAYRWLKILATKFQGRSDISGFSLQMQDIRFFAGGMKEMQGPVTDNVFLYGVLGTWGFSPKADAWRDFQDWHHSLNGSVKPYVLDIVPTRWYMGFERRNNSDSMWEMWHIYHTFINNLFCVYSNLKLYTGHEDILLSFNRKEKGLHFKGTEKEDNHSYLLTKWQESFEKFPDKIVKYNYAGKPIEEPE